MRTFWVHLIFVVIVVGDLWTVVYGPTWLEFNFKPAIMPWIAIYYLWQSANGQAVRLDPFLLPALFFSWIGDILMMFTAQNALAFLIGLGSFLIAQIFYIFTFRALFQSGGKPPRWGMILPIALLLAGYGIGLYFYLLPHLDGVLMVAVGVYATALTGMAISALVCLGQVNNRVFAMLLTGALLFVASDSLIAINKFVAPFPLAGLAIMATYIAAQYLLMRGFLARQLEGRR